MSLHARQFGLFGEFMRKRQARGHRRNPIELYTMCLDDIRRHGFGHAIGGQADQRGGSDLHRRRGPTVGRNATPTTSKSGFAKCAGS